MFSLKSFLIKKLYQRNIFNIKLFYQWNLQIKRGSIFIKLFAWLFVKMYFWNAHALSPIHWIFSLRPKKSWIGSYAKISWATIKWNNFPIMLVLWVRIWKSIFIKNTNKNYITSTHSWNSSICTQLPNKVMCFRLTAEFIYFYTRKKNKNKVYYIQVVNGWKKVTSERVMECKNDKMTTAMMMKMFLWYISFSFLIIS